MVPYYLEDWSQKIKNYLEDTNLSTKLQLTNSTGFDLRIYVNRDI